MSNPIKDKCGFWIYETLPEGSVLLSMDMLLKGALKYINTAFVIYSEEFEEYQCYRVNENTHSRIIAFVELNRVYLLPTNNAVSQAKEGIIPINTELSLEL